MEFVILLPFLIGFLGLIATASLWMAVSSDVQQLAHELARASLPEARSVESEADCETLGERWIGPLASNMPLLDPTRVVEVACQRDADAGILSVTVNYDTRGTLGSVLAGVVGLQIDSFQRSSFIRW